jgi:uncharacterized membrane protein YoaK (UPF0700 family)
MIPIIFFIVLHLLPSHQVQISQQHSPTWVISITITLWMLLIFFYVKKIKSARKGQGLREKLEKYFRLTIVRYSLIVVASLMLAGGFYQTRSDIYTLGFVSYLILAGVIWPTASKVSRELKLRGDEREMVFFKKDKF